MKSSPKGNLRAKDSVKTTKKGGKDWAIEIGTKLGFQNKDCFYS